MRSRSISRRTIYRYMSVFITESERLDSRVISLQSSAVSVLRKRSDFNAVLRLLEGLGYIRVMWADTNVAINAHLTDAGMVFLVVRAEERRKFIISSVVVPIFLSVITSMATVYILPTLGRLAQQWLSGTWR